MRYTARAKYTWLEAQLSQLELPVALPNAICHCDFHYSNSQPFPLNFRIDTYASFDLVALIVQWAWSYPDDRLDLEVAARIVASYNQHRRILAIEQRHFFDLFKLSILIDCLWFYERGSAADFYERQKIGFLDHLGRVKFAAALFRDDLSITRAPSDRA